MSERVSFANVPDWERLRFHADPLSCMRALDDARAALAARDAEIATLKAEVELLRGEVRAADDGSGITNVSEQYEAQLRAEREARERAEAERDVLRMAGVDSRYEALKAELNKE